MNDRAEAERRIERIRAFRDELEALNAAGVLTLTPDQREAIAARHDDELRRLEAGRRVAATSRADELSRGVRLVAFVAAAALLGAVYSMIARFWGRLDLPMQATLLCLFPLASLVGVELAARRERTLYVASLFGLVAFGTFWAAVVVLSALVNVPLNPFHLWAGVVFGLTLALPYGFRAILAATLAILTIAVSGSAFQASGIPWTAVAEHPEVTVAVAFGMTLLAPRLGRLDAGFAIVTRLAGFAIGLVGLLLLSTFGTMSLVPLSSRAVEAFYQAVMLLVCSVVLMAALWRRWTETAHLAAAMLTMFLIVRYADWFWDALPRYAFFLVLAAVALGWLLVLRKLRAKLSTA